MNRIDWWNYRRDFASVARSEGFCSELIAETSSGPIEAWSRRSGGPVTYLSSGIHGDEPAGPMALLEWIRTGRPSRSVDWAVVPMLNPTGLESGTRCNSNGIDLNRDYLSRESAEVAAHVEWLGRLGPPELFLSLHEDWETQGFYMYEICLGGDRPIRAKKLLDAASQVLPLERGPWIDGHRLRADGWIDHGVDPDEPDGWPEAIFLSCMGCPLSFTLETGSQSPLDRRVACHLAVLACLPSGQCSSGPGMDVSPG